jgi:hypothetical protein
MEHLTIPDKDPDGIEPGSSSLALPACTAYPDNGSIVVLKDRLLVCLEANPAPQPGRRG